MVIFEEKNKDKIWSKHTLKRTKLHRFKIFSRGSMPPNPLAMHMANIQIGKKFFAQSLPNPGTPPISQLKPKYIKSLTSIGTSY